MGVEIFTTLPLRLTLIQGKFNKICTQKAQQHKAQNAGGYQLDLTRD